MGLDIHLYKYENFSDTRKRETEYEEYSNALWEADNEDYENIPENRKEEIRALTNAKADELGLDEYGSDENEAERTESDHPKYPDHYFKIGYFRSSYNSTGINRVLKNIGLPTLYEVFDVGDQHEYYIQPEWLASLERAESLIKQFSKTGKFQIHQISQNMFMDEDALPKNEEEVHKLFMDEYERDTKSDFNYSSAKGEFFIHNPLEILAIIPGKTLFNKNGMYIVTKLEDESHDWYLQALEIVRDTCKWVLEQPDKEKYYLHWSG